MLKYQPTQLVCVLPKCKDYRPQVSSAMWLGNLVHYVHSKVCKKFCSCYNFDSTKCLAYTYKKPKIESDKNGR